MKILLLTQVLPYPPDSGPKVKTWNVLKYLAQHHAVTLVSFVRGDQSAAVQHLQRYCRAVHTVPMTRDGVGDGLALLRSLFANEPWMMVRDDRAAMRQLVDRLAAQEHFDIAHADQLNMCQYAARVAGAFTLFDAHNALWVLYKRLAETMPHGPRRWLLERDWRLLKTYEARIVCEFSATTAVIEEDKIALEAALGARSQIEVIPITVDVDEERRVKRRPDAGRVTFAGTMYWPPNIDGVQWFAREVWPLIRRQRPDAAMDIIGARPPPEIAALGQNGSGFTVTGYVDSLTPHLERCGVFIAPLRAGGGMRVKILNALAHGLPIVSTTLGCEGIRVTHEQDILIADTPEAFANAVLRVLQDRALAQRLADNGRRLAETVYDYRVACRPLDDLFQRAQPTALKAPAFDAP